MPRLESDAIDARRPRWFWLGVGAVTAGVLLHLPMLHSARHDHYMLRGMAWDVPMTIGMALVVAGLAATYFGLAPQLARRLPPAAEAPRVEPAGGLTSAHLRLVGALVLAIAIDTQKPFSFAFILPGVAQEYDLSSAAHPAPGHLPVALLPLAGITGTVVGSFLWGFLGDRIGRRTTILLAAVAFMATATCGAMPAFGWNLLMCFLMGMGVGGLLPIAYALLTEMVPSERRGQVTVLVAGAGTAGGFLLTSWLADWLVPTFGWRIMWLLGLPTGLLFVLLSREIPESPRFLLLHGRPAEAAAVMRRYGMRLAEGTQPAGGSVRIGGIFSRPYAALTASLGLYGIAWGLVNFGFLVWLPLDLGTKGVHASTVTTILAKAALFALPGCVAVAFLYGRWSSKGTMILAAALMAASVAVFAVAGPGIARHEVLFELAVVALLVSMWATVSVLAPYSAEIYPTRNRAAGAAFSAAATKFGSVIALSMAVLGVAPPGVRGAALLAALPTAVAALAFVLTGVETKSRQLEEIPLRFALREHSAAGAVGGRLR